MVLLHGQKLLGLGIALALAGCSDAPVAGNPAPAVAGSAAATGGAGSEGGAGVSALAGAGSSPGAAGSLSGEGGTGGVGTAGGTGGVAVAGQAGTAGSATGGAGTAGGGATGGGAGGGAGSATVGVFVAQGHEGRLTRSCDDGLTFPDNSSADDSFRCFIDADHDCDHSEVAGRGLAFGDGSFVATWGWGHPGKLQRSIDGKTFGDVMTATPTFADVAYGNELFVACGNPTRISRDGKAWDSGGPLGFDINYRGIEFVPTAGGTFIVTGESGTQRAISYSHDGKAWTPAGQRPDACISQLRGMAGSDSVMLVAGALGDVCHSTDGSSWTHVAVTDRFTSPPLWTGTEFWIYSGAKLFKSSDGDVWTSQDLVPNNISIGPLARSPQGTLVAANDGWMVWYEKQQFFRSMDGVNWQLLPKSAFAGSHPINFISFGYVPPSSGCGAP